MGVCVPNFRSVSFFVWPGDPVKTDKPTDRPTYVQVKIGISSNGCSPHVDFDKMKGYHVPIVSCLDKNSLK